jgi:TonB-linked SusC/RagA family outer membrane protein
MEGRIAGLSVRNVSGTFGVSPQMNIRGISTIHGNSLPLWVIDGVVVENAVDLSLGRLASGDAVTLISSTIAGLNPDDIASVEVLKDGAAISIYGARATGGVILISTKRAQSEVSGISYHAEFSTRLQPNYGQYKVLSSQQQMAVYQEMESKGWLSYSQLAQSSKKGVYWKMYQTMNAYDQFSNDFILPNQQAMNEYLQKAEMRNTDWLDLLYKNSVLQSHSVNYSKATKKNGVYVSLSAMYDPGWTESSSVSRYTAGANYWIGINEQLKLDLSGYGSYRAQKAPGTMDLQQPLSNGVVYRNFETNPFLLAMTHSRALDPNETYTKNYAAFNLLDELQNNYIDLDQQEANIQAGITWNNQKHFTVTASGAFRYQSSAIDHLINANSNQANAYRAGISPEDLIVRSNNPLLYTNPDNPGGLPETILPNGGIKYADDYDLKQAILKATIGYDTALGNGKQYNLNLLLGAELNHTDRTSNHREFWGWTAGDNADPSELLLKFRALNNEMLDHKTKNSLKNSAGFVSAAFNYQKRLFLELVQRLDGLKVTNMDSRKWYSTSNIALAWDMKNELPSAIIDMGISKLSFRTSFGHRESLPMMIKENYYVGFSRNGTSPEKRDEFSLGATIGFLDNRINLFADAYFRKSHDVVENITYMGASNYFNNASISSKGVEITLNTQNIRHQGFSWSTDITFSKNDNTLTKSSSKPTVFELVSGLGGYSLPGCAPDALFSIPFAGLNSQGVPTFIDENGGAAVGGINFQNVNHTAFLKYEGPLTPTVNGGLSNKFKYKTWEISVFVTYAWGNKIRLSPAFKAAYSDMDAMPDIFKNRWMLQGDESKTIVPTIVSLSQYNNNPELENAYKAYNYSTARVADGGFVRMKEIALSYNFPQAWIKNSSIKGLKIKMQAINPFLIYRDKKLRGQDPENIPSGGVSSPVARQYTVSFNLNI